MSKPPQLTLEERRDALAKAALARKIRASFKAEIKSGARSWLDALESNEEAIARMRVRELVASVPGLGEVRALAILEKVGISPTRRIQGLGRTQRDSLVKILKGRI